MNQELQKLNLADDFLFAKVMSDPRICKKVLEKILAIEIEHIEYPQYEKAQTSHC